MLDFLMIERFMMIDCFRHATPFPLGLFHLRSWWVANEKFRRLPPIFLFFSPPLFRIFIFLSPLQIFPRTAPTQKKNPHKFITPHTFLSDFWKCESPTFPTLYKLCMNNIKDVTTTHWTLKNQWIGLAFLLILIMWQTWNRLTHNIFRLWVMFPDHMSRIMLKCE